MKLNNIIAAAAFGTTAVSAAEGASAASKIVEVMALKSEQWDEARAASLLGGSALYSKCNNINLISFLSHEDVGSANKVGNDIWGWMSKRSGRELSIIGQTDGVAFVELKKDGSLVYLCRLPTQTDVVSWRDIKVIKDHAYISSEANGHGLQILDLNKLLNVKKPKVFSKETDITLYTGFGASHNIVAHEEIDLIYAVGDRSGANAHLTTCAGGFFMVDVSDPKTPFPPSRVGQDGYVHDAQCVIYKGPSKKYRNREICFAFHEDTLTVMDMTNKKDPIVGSRTLTLGTPTDTRAGLLTSPWLYQHWSLPEPSPLYRP